MYLMAPVSTFLAERYGCRIVVIAGGIISAVSMGSSSFAKSIAPLYVTYGVLWGIGTSFGLFPSLVMLTKYFRRRLALVNGMALTGAAVGGLALGPLMQFFATRFGTPNMFRFLGALNVLVIFSGLLYRPLHEENSESKASKEPLRNKIKCLFRHKAYVIWLIALCTLMIVFLVPFVHLVSSFQAFIQVHSCFCVAKLSRTVSFNHPLHLLHCCHSFTWLFIDSFI